MCLRTACKDFCAWTKTDHYPSESMTTAATRTLAAHTAPFNLLLLNLSTPTQVHLHHRGLDPGERLRAVRDAYPRWEWVWAWEEAWSNTLVMGRGALFGGLVRSWAEVRCSS